MTTAIKSISVSLEFAKLAEDNKLSWSTAAITGMAMMLGDLGLKEYDNQLNLFRKMQAFQKMAQDALQKLSEFEEKQKCTEQKSEA